MPRTVITPIAARGLATSFAEAETPTDFAVSFTNRYINGSGDAEKREGIVQTGSALPNLGNVTGLHELINERGNSIKFASSDGAIYRREDDGGWTLEYTFPTTTHVIRSVQMNDKIIFFNDADASTWTDDGLEFRDLKAVLEIGTASSSTSTTFKDVDVSSWAVQTLVSENDLVYWPSTGATAIITSVSGSEIRHSVRDGTNFGFAAAGATNGEQYEIYDSIELNIFNTKSGLYKDNVATATFANSTEIQVSGVNWDNTEIRVGDIVYNTTRGSGAYVTKVSGFSLETQAVSGQTTNDSLTFLKPGAPIIANATVHFGRLYAIDSRDKRKIRISGAVNPLDWSVDSATLDLEDFGGLSKGNEYNAGSLSSEGEKLQSLTTFQQFLILGGSRNLYAFSGTQPFGEDADFRPLAVLPTGVKSPDALVNLGNDVGWISDNGVQLYSFTEQNSIIQKTISESLNKTLRTIIKNSDEADLKLLQYNRRQWMLAKVGSEFYVWNFAPITLARNNTRETSIPSWFRFQGPFATQYSYKVMSDGNLWCGGGEGIVSIFEQGTYDDNGQVYETDYETGWLHLDSQRTEETKTLKFLEPYFETGTSINYSVSVEGDWEQNSRDSRTVSSDPSGSPVGGFTVGSSTIGGSSIFHPKLSMRARGKAFRFRFRTFDNKGPDIISRFAVHYNRMGRR